MADKISVEHVLKMQQHFTDNDTRVLEVDNPIENLTKADIKAAEAALKSSQLFIGDKTGAPFSRLDTAKTIKKTTTKLDLR